MTNTLILNAMPDQSSAYHVRDFTTGDIEIRTGCLANEDYAPTLRSAFNRSSSGPDSLSIAGTTYSLVRHIKPANIYHDANWVYKSAAGQRVFVSTSHQYMPNY